MGLHVLFPGSFDPPTLGHVDCGRRAAALFERVTIAVADHPTKDPLFTAAERQALLEACFAEEVRAERMRVVRHAGLVVDACRTLGCQAILRGARSGADFDYEHRMAATNRVLAPQVDTLVIGTAPALSHVSSTLVRQIARLGGDVSALVPAPVVAALRERMG